MGDVAIHQWWVEDDGVEEAMIEAGIEDPVWNDVVVATVIGSLTDKTASGAALLDAAWKARTEGNCGELDGAIRDMFGLAASFTPAKEEEEEHRNLCADNDVAYIEWLNAAAREQQKEKDMETREEKTGDLTALDESIVKYEGLLERVNFNTGVVFPDDYLGSCACLLCLRHREGERDYEHRHTCGRCQLGSCSDGTAYSLMLEALRTGDKPEFIKQRDVILATMREAASRLRKELAAEEWPKWYKGNASWTRTLVVEWYKDRHTFYTNDGEKSTYSWPYILDSSSVEITKAQADKLIAKRDKRLEEEKLEAERKKNGERCELYVDMGTLGFTRHAGRYSLEEAVGFPDFAGYEYADGSVRNVSLVWKIGSAFYDTNPRADDAYRVACHRPVAVLFK